MNKNLLKSLLTALLFSGIASYAQPTLTAGNTNPIVGESTVFNVDTAIAFTPGNSGANQSWNLSSLATDISAASTFVLASGTPYAGNFTGANIASSSAQGYGYMNETSSALQYYGVGNSSLLMAYSDPEDLLHYPFSYNDTYADSWMTVYTYGGYTFYRTGVTTVTADAYGTLVTPLGTFTNVLRIHEVQVYQDSAYIGFPYVLTYNNDQYMWYDANLHTSLASMYEFTSSTGASSTAGSYLSDLIGIEKISQFITAAFVSPSPASDNLSIDFTLTENKDADITIFNSFGEKVKFISGEKTFMGSNSVKLNVSDLADGIYFAQIAVKGDIASTKKFVVAK